MNILEWIKSLFNKFIKIFKQLIADAFPVAKMIIIGQLRDIALEFVREIATIDISNTEKRSQAFGRIKTYAITHGITASDSIINVVVEMAVQLYKEEFE